MNKGLVVGISVAAFSVVVITGAAVFFVRLSQSQDSPSKDVAATDSSVANQSVGNAGKFSCGHDDPDLCKFFEKLATKTPYFLTGAPGRQTVTTASGSRTQFTVETDKEGNESIIRTEGDKETARLIIGNHTLYRKNFKTDTWTTRPISDDEINSIDLSYYVDVAMELSDPKDTYERMEPETCGSLTCLHYRVPIAQSSSGAGYMDIYFDSNEYLMRKVIGKFDDRTEEFMPFYKYGTVEIPK